jgi:hypothetical protein
MVGERCTIAFYLEIANRNGGKREVNRLFRPGMAILGKNNPAKAFGKVIEFE